MTLAALAPNPVELSGQRRKVFLDRYALKDAQGQPLESNPDEMWRRVATGLAEVDRGHGLHHVIERHFYEAMRDFKAIPAGRILSGAGTPFDITYYNCYVIDQPADSRGGIMDNLKTLVEIMARGGGVGVNLSSLRPRGSYIKSVNGTSSGPVSWAELYSVITGKVIQQGGTRRGALMIMLDDDHPDLVEFIKAKRIDPLTNKPIAIEHANVSIAVSDAFMQAVKDDALWVTQFPTKANLSKLVAEREAAQARGDIELPALPQVTYGTTYQARDLWTMIAAAAHNSAEPGVVFMDRCQNESNTWYYERIRTVNPCGEQPLGDFGVCNLGHLNLSAYVDGPIGKGTIDLNRLKLDTATLVRMLDNVIDANSYFLPENEAAQKGTRRIGLGTMGLADALIKLGLRYGSKQAEGTLHTIYGTIAAAAYEASSILAMEKGSFPNFDRDKFMQGSFIKRLPTAVQDRIHTHGIRNGVILTQAPTGTTSLLANVSSGIEPVFALVTKRVDRTGEHIMHHPLVAQYQHERLEEAGTTALTEAGATIVARPLPEFFVTSAELTPEEHINVQAIVQFYTDSSISKTVNAPQDSTVADVERLYMLAYDSGCKGVTYYRDGSRDAVLSAVVETKGQTNDDTGRDPSGAGNQQGATGGASPLATHGELVENAVVGGTRDGGDSVGEQNPDDELAVVLGGRERDTGGNRGGIAVERGQGNLGRTVKRAELLTGYTRNIPAPEGTAHITINGDKAGPLEVFVTVGKAGSDVMALAEAMGRLISYALRNAEQRWDCMAELGEQLRGIGGSRAKGFGMNQTRSLADAVGKALLEHPGLMADLEPRDPTEPTLNFADADEAVAWLADEVTAVITEQINQPTAPKFSKPSGIACPECGNWMAMEESCKKCHACGYSEC